MSITRRQFTALLPAAALGASRAARAAAPEAVTLDVLHAFPAQDAYYQEVAKAFAQAHPEITIRFRASPETYLDSHQAALRGLMTNQSPDVYHSGFLLDNELIATLKKRNRAVSLQPYLDAEGKDWVAANYEPGILALGQVDGTQYGMAFAASTPIIFFNADLVKRAGGDPASFPTTWDALLALGGRIKQLGDGVDGMAYDIHAWPDDWLWQALIMQQGDALLDASGAKVAFGGESGMTALNLAVRCVKEGGMAMRDYDQSRQQFVAGKIGFIFASPNSARAFTDLVGSKFQMGSQVYPRLDAQKGRVPTGGNAMMILSSDEKKRKAAWQYIKFASSPEGQKIAVLGSGYMPTNKRALEQQYLGEFYDKNPNWKTSISQIPYSVAWMGYPGTNGVKIWQKQRDIIGLVMRGDLQPADGLKQMVQVTNELMA